MKKPLKMYQVDAAGIQAAGSIVFEVNVPSL